MCEMQIMLVFVPEQFALAEQIEYFKCECILRGYIASL